jgi:hypothetical protein
MDKTFWRGDPAGLVLRREGRPAPAGASECRVSSAECRVSSAECRVARQLTAALAEESAYRVSFTEAVAALEPEQREALATVVRAARQVRQARAQVSEDGRDGL